MRGAGALGRSAHAAKRHRRRGLIRIDPSAQLRGVIRRDQLADVGFDKIGIAQRDIAIMICAAQRLDQIMRCLRRMKAKLAHRIACKNAQRFADHRPARAWRRRRDHMIAPVIAFHRGQIAHFIGGKVLRCKDTAILAAGVHQLCGDCAAVKSRRAVPRDAGQRAAKIGLYQPLARRPRLALIEENRCRGWILGKILCASFQHRRVAAIEHKSF